MTDTSVELPASKQDILQWLRASLEQENVGVSSSEMGRVGLRLHQDGELEAALKAFECAVSKSPGDINYWHAIATVCSQLQLPKAALEACNKALAIDPENADSLCNTATVLEALGDSGAALHCYNKALQLVPGHARALRNKPWCYAALEQRNLAIDAALAAVATYPKDAGLYFNLGELYLGTAEAKGAIAAYRTCIELEPMFYRARYALSIALAAAGEVREAVEVQHGALAEYPNLPSEYKSPIKIDELAGDHDVAPARIAALAIANAFRNYDWRAYAEGIELFAALIKGECGDVPLCGKEAPYLSMLMPAPMNSALRQKLAQQTARRIIDNTDGMDLVRLQRSIRTKIRIAYIAGSFRAHPVTQLMGDGFARHDRSVFDVYAYALGPRNDSFERHHVRKTVDVFREVGHLPALSVAQIIVNDEIDVLIDLSGYNRDSRPEILALRPAPIQVSYLDFMSTLGAPFIDYTMLDRRTLTEQERLWWDEKVAYMPHCSYHCEWPLEPPPALPRADLGLPENGVVLGALHHPRKLDPRSVNVWLDLLREIPGSVLWLLHENREQVDNLCAFAIAAGIAPERLIFSPFRPRREYLACFRLIDVHLDLFVFNGHTTTTDALGTGTPMVTLAGDTVVSRVAATMVTAHGLPELVAESPEQYKDIVRRLISDPVWATQIRARTAKPSNGNLFCPERRIREMEMAYRMMWARHQAGLPPADFDVPEWAPPSAARS